MPDSEITIVLVHGAWAECASWGEIILPLQKQGWGVTCAPIPLTTLGEDVGALDRALGRIEGDIVLVGHAYAGAVIGATKNERVKLLVYVAALAPDEGETVADVFYREQPASRAGPRRLGPDEKQKLHMWMPPEGFEQAFAQNALCPGGEGDTLCATQRPINNVKCIQEKVPRPLWRGQTVVVFSVSGNDRMIPAKTPALFPSQTNGCHGSRLCLRSLTDGH